MNNSPVKVSVVIPVYNSKEYLERCIESVVNQTLQEIEIIVVDDGSTDGSWHIIRDFAEKDNRVIPIRQRNQGVSAARNAGLERATGEYVGFVDSDDFVSTGYFSELYSAGTDKDADIVIGYVAMDNERRQHFYNYTNKRAAMKSKYALMGVVWLNIYKNTMLKQNNVLFPSNLRTAEDNLFNLQATYYANKVVSTDDSTAVYCHEVREGSLTTQQSDSRNILLLSRAILETVSLLNSLDSYNEEVYVARVLDTLNYFYQRFIESEELNVSARYRITMIFVRIWRRVKYREQLLEKARERDIDLQQIVYGRVVKRLYKRYAIELKGARRKKKHFSRESMKVLLKRSVRFVTPYGIMMRYKRRLESPAGAVELDSSKIAVVAAYRDTEYIKLLKKSIQKAGYNVTNYPSDAKYVWLHWYENGLHNYDDFVRKISAIQSWKAQGRKIILHIHNKKPHESKMPSVSHALMTTLADSSDHVSIMSAETKEVLKDIWYFKDDFSRVSTVQHPNYIEVYGGQVQPSVLKDDTLKVLFFGQVRPYKGIEHLIEATKDLSNIEISIFGKPKDEQYIEALHRLCEGRTNVTFRLEFIPNKDIPEIFANHHIVALPYSKESSLNSGAAVLALSYGRTVIGTNNGTLKELPSNGMYFGYDYKDEEDHTAQLRRSIQSIQQDYGRKYNELLKVGSKALEYVEKENSLDAIARSIQDMMRRIT